MESPIHQKIICNKTPVHPCGYLPQKQAVTRFMPMGRVKDQKQFTQLNAAGFRRSGDYVYRPACPTCSACVPLRINSSSFIPNKSQKRCWKKNVDLSVSPEKAGFTKERYTLYEQYIHSRHADGDMFPPSKQQFIDFLCEGTSWCRFHEFRDTEGQLVAVTVVDHLTNGIAPIYTFFNPALSKRGLGTYSILWLIEYTKDCQLFYVYLGYWIKKCGKMSYKCKFRPYELLRQGLWVQSKEPHTQL